MILNCINLKELRQIHLIKVLLAIGLEGFIKNFLIFSFYGFAVTLCIDLVCGLKKDLPDSIESILTGPLSFYTFIAMLVFSIIALLISSKMGSIECDFHEKRPKRIFYFSIPFCEVSISIGVVICGSLLGIGIALHVISLWDDVAKGLYAALYACSLFTALFLYPFILMIVSMLDQENKALKQSFILNILYIAIISLYGYYKLPLHDVVMSSIVIFLIVIGVIGLKFALKKHNN